MSKANRESAQIPLKLFNVMGASELRHNRALIIVIAISVILGIVIAALAKIISDQNVTIRLLQDSRVMYGFPNSEGVFGVVRRNPRNFRQPSSSPATSASRSMNLPSVWKV